MKRVGIFDPVPGSHKGLLTSSPFYHGGASYANGGHPVIYSPSLKPGSRSHLVPYTKEAGGWPQPWGEAPAETTHVSGPLLSGLRQARENIAAESSSVSTRPSTQAQAPFSERSSPRSCVGTKDQSHSTPYSYQGTHIPLDQSPESIVAFSISSGPCPHSYVLTLDPMICLHCILSLWFLTLWRHTSL